MSPRSKTAEPEATTKRPKLTDTAILSGAVALADRVGMEGFTIRKLADELGTKPMTIYYHVPNKEAIIDGMIDIVFSEIELPPADADWKAAMRQRSHSARLALARHPWATPLMDSRMSPGPFTLRHHDAVIGCFRNGGFSVEMTGHAYALVDSFIHGFALQEANMPATGGTDIAELANTVIEPLPTDEYPFLAELTGELILQPDYDYGNEFSYGLDLILDGLEAASGSND